MQTHKTVPPLIRRTPSRAVAAVAGENAGGNMAASICLQARAQRLQMPVHQLLVYPMTNYDFTTQSYQENEHTKPLSAEGMERFFKYHPAQPSAGKRSALVSHPEYGLQGTAARHGHRGGNRSVALGRDGLRR